MNVVLDTSALIAGDRPTGTGEAFVTSVSLAELEMGVHLARNGVERAQRQTRLDAIRREYGAGLPFDDAAAAAFGVVAGIVAALGRNPRSRIVDLQIAATAYANGLGVLTRNPRDFMGLEALVPVRTP